VVKQSERVSCDLVMRRRGGSAFHGRLDCSRRAGDGSPGVRIVLTDLTERDRADEELRTTQRLESLALLAGGIAHDFNNLLTALFGHIEAARATIPVDGPADQDLRIALSSLDGARGLTRQLLVFAGGGEPHRTAVAVPKALANAVALVLGGSSVRAQVEAPADLPPVDADEGQLGQLLDNLLLNARQAMPSGGEVRISAARRRPGAEPSPTVPGREFVEISVQDHGQGIPPAILPKIFEPFFSTRMSGRGLGLAVCHSLARRHGGHIAVQSEEGVGTTFTVLLPVALAVTVAGPAPVRRPAGSPSAKLRVLIMDDEPMVLRAGARHLRALGCAADSATCGEEVLALYQRALEAGAPYDVVILDLTVVSGMGGERTIEKLRLLDPQVVAVACSGYFEGGIMADPTRHGFRAVLPKPYVRADLSAVLDLVTAS
jgi:signal transduction histidine kinase/ActR/RegA family two-component response regulator